MNGRPAWMLAMTLTLLAASVAAGEEVSGLQVLAAAEDALTQAIARSEKSVVAIARVRKERPGESFNFEFRPDPFGRRILPSASPEPTDPDFIPAEYGAGVVIDRRGLILTAYHVLGDGDKLNEENDYYVTTHDRRVYLARVRAADPRSDLAVLAVDAELPPITLGDGGALRKGQIVIALGNPYAIARDGQASASWGIVSNLSRKAPPLSEQPGSADQRTLHEFGTLIQTDAKLALGASGGALLNFKGEMVGLTVALAATAGYEQQAGYAIPIDAAFRRVVDTLKEGREVEYGFLGVQPGKLSRADVLSGRQGVWVEDVVVGTPAEEAGVLPNDVIQTINGAPIRNRDDLMLELGRLPAAAEARLAVRRGNEDVQLAVTLAKFPVGGPIVVTERAPAWRGAQVDYTTVRGQYTQEAIDYFPEGVLVTEVEEHSPAWQAGLRVGMTITHVERRAVARPADFRAAVTAQTGPVALRIDPGAGAPLTAITVPAP